MTCTLSDTVQMQMLQDTYVCTCDKTFPKPSLTLTFLTEVEIQTERTQCVLLLSLSATEPEGNTISFVLCLELF